MHARATKGVIARPAQNEVLRRFGENAMITTTANKNAASAFRVFERIIEASPKTSSSTYQAFLFDFPHTGSKRHKAMIESTAPEVPTLFEASTGSTPVRRPPSMASVGQIGKLHHTPTSDSP